MVFEQYREWASRLKPTLRQVHVAGEKALVDYSGHTLEVIEVVKMRSAQIFAAVLGVSKYTYAEASFSQSLPDWIASRLESHPVPTIPDVGNIGRPSSRPVLARIREIPREIGRSAMDGRIAKRTQLARLTINDFFSAGRGEPSQRSKKPGPTTDEGKQHSRCNAVRHGLTAETVIGALEDAEDYKAFEAAVIADYDAQSAVESELVLRLASLPWRLRRATTMEIGYSRFRLIIWARSSSRTKFAQALEGLSMPYLEVLTQAVSTQIQHRTPVRTNLETSPSKQLCISPANSHVAFCNSPICPTTRSTASADMKQPLGVRPGRFCLHLISWVAANQFDPRFGWFALGTGIDFDIE